MNLLDLSYLLNRDSKAGDLEPKVHAFHSFNQITMFITEPRTKFPFILTCKDSNIFGLNLIVRTYKFKPPVEFLDELFYYNKINYYVKSINSVALAHLFSGYKLHPELSNKRNKYDYVNKSFGVKKWHQKYHLLVQIIQDFQKAYTKMIIDPQKYFSIVPTSKLDSKQMQLLKQNIKKTELNKDNIFEKELHKYDDLTCQKSNNNKHKNSSRSK